MATPDTKQIRFIRKLREQLGFIERSCQAFDRGAEDEAIRIATSLRVVFHNKNRNVSLLTHLGLGATQMLSSARGFGDWRDYLGHKLTLTSSEPVTMVPLLGDKFRSISMQDWWDKEPAFVHDGESYSRKDIILSVTDKDGGAHVDAVLEKYYESLCTGEYALSIIGDLTYAGAPPFQQGVPQYAKNAHLALIRQFGHEASTSAKYFVWLKDQPQK